MPCPPVCYNLLHRNVLFVPAPTERVWTMALFSSTTCMRKSYEKKGKKDLRSAIFACRKNC